MKNDFIGKDGINMLNVHHGLFRFDLFKCTEDELLYFRKQINTELQRRRHKAKKEKKNGHKGDV